MLPCDQYYAIARQRRACRRNTKEDRASEIQPPEKTLADLRAAGGVNGGVPARSTTGWPNIQKYAKNSPP